MHEIAFTVGKLSIHWYGVFVALAFVVAMSTLLIERKRAGITPDNVFDLALIAIFGGVFGARLLCRAVFSSVPRQPDRHHPHRQGRTCLLRRFHHRVYNGDALLQMEEAPDAESA